MHLHRFLAWAGLWLGLGRFSSATSNPAGAPGLPPSPPPTTAPPGTPLDSLEESGQELSESRERILSRLMTWRLEQCQRELRSPLTNHATLIPFPLTDPPQNR